MTLKVTISGSAARWLAEKARSEGADEASVASQVLERAAAEQAPLADGVPDSAVQRKLREFDEWIATLPGRGGRADTSTDSLYD